MKQDLPLLVVVTGSPASGKSTLAEKLSESMRLPLLAKDAFKEEIYDNLEGAAPADSHRLGFVAVRLMHSWSKRLLEKGVSLVLESNFKRSLSLPDLESLFALSQPVVVQCVAPRDEVVDRYVERSEEGERHPVHDDANHVDELRHDLEKGEYDMRFLDVPVITVDTSIEGGVDIEALIHRIRSTREARSAGSSTRR
ncbi:MAG TPA: AAA family ATPase [Thermomicrobiales bacterium]|jgi:predicted kinase|nr:AAA family ATPase [Thermomicrobiales bacterium]